MSAFENEDPLEELKKLKVTPPPTMDGDPLAELVATRKRQPLPGVSGHPIVDASPEQEAGIGTKILGTVAALDRDIPGMEAVQSGVRAVLRRQSYRDARNDIRGGEDSAPAIARTAARLTGGTLAAMATPGSTALSGARYGVLNALGDSDPDATVKDRLHNSVTQGAFGALGGKFGETVGTLARAKLPTMLGGALAPDVAMLARKLKIQGVDRVNFGKAADEGDAYFSKLLPSKTTPELSNALEAPGVKKFAELVRGSRQFAGADDATVLRETYKLMGKQQQGFLQKLKQYGFDAELQRKADDIGLAKEELLNAADKVMPSFRAANEASSVLRGERDTFKQGMKFGKNVIMNAQPGINQFDTQSAATLKDAIPLMDAGQAKTTRDAVLSVLKSKVRPNTHLTQGFGLGSSLARSGRAGPVITALDRQAGPTVDAGAGLGKRGLNDLLKSFGISALTPSNQ